jgi:hypothetical protein
MSAMCASVALRTSFFKKERVKGKLRFKNPRIPGNDPKMLQQTFHTFEENIFAP